MVKVMVKNDQEVYDTVVWRLRCLAGVRSWPPLGYQVDVRPQKGQLAVIETDWDILPLIMPEGEGILSPFRQENLCGCSHEDEQGLIYPRAQVQLSGYLFHNLSVGPWIGYLSSHDYKIGSRAYTLTNMRPSMDTDRSDVCGIRLMVSVY